MSELQHPNSRSFERVADVYERSRPMYPAAAVAWVAERLDLRPGRTVLDLAAGTGKLTRSLVETGARVIAVEPGDAMRAMLVERVPSVEALRGAAEAIPLADDSVDAVAVGQGFHGFRHEEAVPELHRVLRPGGGVALLWNTRDADEPVHRAIGRLISELVPARAPHGRDSTRHLPESGLFGPIEQCRFPFIQELDADGLVARIASVSIVAAAPVEARVALERKLRELVAASGGSVTFPYVTEVYVSRAL